MTVEQQLGVGVGCERRATSGATRIGSGRRSRSTPASTWGWGRARSNGVAYPVCSTNANLNSAAGAVSAEPDVRPRSSAGWISTPTSGYQNYRGLKLSAQRRVRQRREPERQLHAVALLRDPQNQPLQPDERRLSESGRSGVRRRLLRPGSETPGDADGGLRDAGGGQRRAARASPRTGGCRGS